jgi:hypothetical protein
MKKIIFINGCGRSGTHLVGRALSSHPEITGRIEDPGTFNLIVKIATEQDIQNKIYMYFLRKKLDSTLMKILSISVNHVLEKSHPSLWLVDHLSVRFENSYFVAIIRGLEPTVSSMLEHKGVLSWYEKLPQNKPNRFFGITEQNKTIFQNFSIEEKCALRWLSHKNEINRLQKKYPKNMIVIQYEDFILSPYDSLKKISSFLMISNRFNPEEIKLESKDKWKRMLNAEQIKKIHRIIEEYDQV